MKHASKSNDGHVKKIILDKIDILRWENTKIYLDIFGCKGIDKNLWVVKLLGFQGTLYVSTL